MADNIKIKDEDILEILKSDIDRAKNIQVDLAMQRETYYNLFRGNLYGNEREGWAQSVAPIVWSNHQGNISTLIEIFSEDFFTLKSDNHDRATKFQKLIHYQMFRKQDGYRRLYDFLFDAGVYHYGAFKCCYREDYDIVTESYDRLSTDEMLALAQDPSKQVTKYTEAQTAGDPMLGTPPETYYEKVKVARKDVFYAGPSFEVVPPWELFYSADCKTDAWGSLDGRLVYHQVKLSLNEIHKREKAGIYRKGTYSQCKEKAGGGDVFAEKFDELAVKFTFDELSQQSTDSDRKDILGREYSVRECYCKLDIDNDGLLEHCIVVIIEEEIVAQVEENPYRRPPFRLGSMIPEPHKVHGIAPPSILDNDQKIMTNLLRFIQDSAAMSTYRNPITNDPRLQQMLTTRKPFDAILGDPGKIGEVPVQPPDQFILKAWELLKGENEEKTGMSRYNQGMDAQSLNKTATGISLISQASMKRIRMSAKLLGNGPLTGLIRDFIFINQKWRGQDPIRLFGTDLVVNPEDLDGEYDIEIDIGVSPAEKQQTANQLDLLVQFGTQAGMQMGIMTPLHILKAQKKKFSQLNINVDDLMVSEQEFIQQQQMQQQQQMMQQQQMAQQQMMGQQGPPQGPQPNGPPMR